MIRLYHGTDAFFERPDLAVCRPVKDFGRGFYLTPELAVAKRMAERCVERSDWQGAPKYVYVYDFDDMDLSGLTVKRFAPAVDEEFARFVMANRQARSRSADHNRDNRYDIVLGPVANDNLYATISLYENGELSAEAAIVQLKTHVLFNQVSFHTQTAINNLKFVEAVEV